MFGSCGHIDIQVGDHRRSGGGHAKDPAARVGIGVVILAKLEKDLVIPVGHREMVGGVSPPLGLVKGLLVEGRIGNSGSVGRSAALIRRVIAPSVGASELLVRGPGGGLGIDKLGAAAIDPDGQGRISR